MIFPATPSQTVGPCFAIALPWEVGPYAVADGTPRAIRIVGTIFDGDSEPVPDHLLETWQADPSGRFADLHGYGGPSELERFRGLARYGIEDGDGSFEIVTVKPGSVPGTGETTQVPHIDVSGLARGMLQRCVTRIYFADEPDANAADAILATAPEARRSTFLAQPIDGGYRFDIHLQGPEETVFFAV